ncbi:AAA domain-containing protein [Clostridium intestinale]|uniref:Superfamily I DNA and/or RNA helicase n=1 Tax=Clostridium intestinale DSM 6191 TaxID=1121320 RepID=A0A1M5T1N6_9CLOT|nr:AAA domain-containing protein [Clostridium intestinale]SHH44578.1 Superfamily I DNA and/or RNA helicase [Clostridium intestinale DSM 6191]
MNIEKNLILIKGEDKTSKVTYCEYTNGKYQVTFDNNKSYTYNYNNVNWLRNPVELNPETTILYKDNQPISGIDKILRFDGYVRVCFKSGYTKSYPMYNLTIEETCLNKTGSSNCFDYLKSLSALIKVSQDEEDSFLNKQYNKIKAISPRSVLDVYLNPKELKKRENRGNTIFPFGFNLSQKSATDKALTNQISVIEGPPGTGKTQTILNIIANAIVNNKTVAVVSNNNSATLNVLEKLDKYGVGFIAAYLGNKENKENFFNNQPEYNQDIENWQKSSEDLEKIKSKLINSQKKLEEMLDKQNTLASLKQELSELSTEIEYFNSYYDDNMDTTSYRAIFRHNSNKVMSILVNYNAAIMRHEKFLFRHKLRNLISHGIFSFNFYNRPYENIVDHLKKLYYDLKLKELNKDIESLEKELDRFSFKDSMEEYSKNSMLLLQANLANRFKNKGNRVKFSKDDLWKNFDSFIKEYPVILSTTHSLRSCASENYLFDYIILDEASQVDIVSGALALSCAKNAVIVGDLKQLPIVVNENMKAETTETFNRFNLNSAYSYKDNSLLSSIIALFEDVPKTLLKEHYRCHPKIIGFCNKKFYNNELIVLTKESEDDKPLTVCKTVKGNHARGTSNQRQIDIILEEVIPALDIGESNKSIGIVSPYRAQTEKLQALFNSTDIEADTVHKYQGREKETIILTTVSNDINDFIDDPKLINVAISRAENKLILIISDNYTSSKNSNIGDLIRYIKYNNLEIINSEIYSVFDLLYKCYSKELLKVLSKSKKVSKEPSEILMDNILEELLGKDEFKVFDKVLHHPLKMLIRDTSKLNEEEYRFVTKTQSHNDFVIFNKIDKMPVLAVEVDGYKYHENNPAQLKRDKMKDEILRKYDIPILRFSSVGSGEEKILSDKLLSLVK